jgi:dephospho-CoA kinase
MKIIGLTGGIASGKNFVAEIFQKNGAAVFDADKEVHELLESHAEAIKEVKENFPESVIGEKISRKLLGQIVFSDPQKLKILEKIIHVKVREEYQIFLQKAVKEKKKLAILNIPLLLETQSYKCDKVVAIIVLDEVQKKRFLMRAKKTDPENFLHEKENLIRKFEKIKSKQIDNLKREKHADFVINNSLTKAFTIKQVKKIIAEIL